MKRFTAVLLVFIALALTTTAVYASGLWHFKRATFYTTPACNPYTLDTATKGRINISGPDKRNALEFAGFVTGLDPNTNYDFFVRDLTGYTGPVGPGGTANLGWFSLRRFKTNSHGDAWFLLVVKRSYLPTGTYPIQVAIDTTVAPTCTKLATQEAVFTLVVP